MVRVRVRVSVTLTCRNRSATEVCMMTLVLYSLPSPMTWRTTYIYSENVRR